MNRATFALAATLATMPHAYSANYEIPSGEAYNLAVNVNAAGNTAQVQVVKGTYILACVASNWNGASAQLQALGPDGATWLTGGVTPMTTNGTQIVLLGSYVFVRVAVTGTPTALDCSLS